MRKLGLPALVAALAIVSFAACDSYDESTPAASDAGVGTSSDATSSDALVAPGADAADAGEGGSCACFATGHWKIANTAPCIWSEDGKTYYAYSTTPPEKEGDGPGKCTLADHLPVGETPKQAWSKSTLTVDCAGTFRLCYRLRAGDAKNPKAIDCIVAESCVSTFTYPEANKEMALPDLPAWYTDNTACVTSWEKTSDDKSPGYAEMGVTGQTDACGGGGLSKSEELVFHRVAYCPRKCRDPKNANDVECQECQLGADGKF